VRGGLFDDRYGFPGDHNLFACPVCGHTFLGSSLTDEELLSLYTDFYPRQTIAIEDFQPPVEIRGLSLWLDGERASAFRWVPRNVRILDIGCGLGETLAYHEGRGCDAHGIDADTNLHRFAEHFALNARVGLFAAKDYPPASFDFVTLDQVLEHSADPRAFIGDVATVLRPGGKAIVTTPNAHGWGARTFGTLWINWHVPYHLQHFSRRSLTFLAEQSGFEIAAIKTITNSRWLQYQFLHMLNRPSNGTPSPFWDPERSPLTVRRGSRRIGAFLNRVKAFHAVTRVADMCGVGDNLVCILRKVA
jgi:SAM-dependent methyltransferase